MVKVSSFYMGIYDVVDDPSLDSIISWSKSNKSFIVWNPAEFHRRVLWNSAVIACFDFTTFFSELKRHGFKRIKGTENHLEFGHAKYFVRGQQPDLMKNMQKKAFRKHNRETCAQARREAKAAMELKARKMEVAGSLARLRL